MNDAHRDRRLHSIDVLKSEECQCGEPKKQRMAFCYSCFKILPDHMQKAIYRKIGNGFDEALETSAEWLRDKEARG